LKKTFNNHDKNQNTDQKKPGVIVIEEPDEEPKIYEQVYDENVEADFGNRKQYKQLPLILSCSTINSNKYRRNKMKYQRQNGKRNYEPPPRFQKENNFNIPPNFNPQWKFNGYQHRSRLHIPPRFVRLKDQQKSQAFRRTPKPTTIADHFIFTNDKQQQTPCVDRTRSECRSKLPFRNRNKIPQYFDYRQQYFTRFISPSTPILFRNTQIQFRLFNHYHPNSNHF